MSCPPLQRLYCFYRHHIQPNHLTDELPPQTVSWAVIRQRFNCSPVKMIRMVCVNNTIFIFLYTSFNALNETPQSMMYNIINNYGVPLTACADDVIFHINQNHQATQARLLLLQEHLTVVPRNHQVLAIQLPYTSYRLYLGILFRRPR